MTINYNVTGEKRKALVHDIEALTGIKAVYMKMPCPLRLTKLGRTR